MVFDTFLCDLLASEESLDIKIFAAFRVARISYSEIEMVRKIRWFQMPSICFRMANRLFHPIFLIETTRGAFMRNIVFTPENAKDFLSILQKKQVPGASLITLI